MSFPYRFSHLERLLSEMLFLLVPFHGSLCCGDKVMCMNTYHGHVQHDHMLAETYYLANSFRIISMFGQDFRGEDVLLFKASVYFKCLQAACALIVLICAFHWRIILFEFLQEHSNLQSRHIECVGRQLYGSKLTSLSCDRLFIKWLLSWVNWWGVSVHYVPLLHLAWRGKHSHI